MQGMLALNKEWELKGQALAYDDEAFFNLIEKYGLEHNTVLNYMRREGL